MRGEWWGALGEAYFKAFGRPSHNELLAGIPTSPADQYAAPFAITEEFTAVYRLHSLVPDDFSFRRHDDDKELLACTFADLFAGGTTKVQHTVPFDDVLYSLGTSYPGAPVLHNYPTHLRRLPENIDQGIMTDLAATDILRDRERGVPRYCAFRRMLRMSVPKTFQELTDNEAWQRDLARIYDDVERVDLLTGTLAETKPPGFAISDTSFRIFIVMAGRRIKSDRFLTDDYTPEVYTPVGIDWVESKRHARGAAASRAVASPHSGKRAQQLLPVAQIGELASWRVAFACRALSTSCWSPTRPKSARSTIRPPSTATSSRAGR